MTSFEVADAGLVRSFGNPRPIGKLVVDERGVLGDGELLLARADIRSGYVQPRVDSPPWVRLEGRRRFQSVTLVVANEAEGAALLRALGLDAARSLAVFRVKAGLLASKRAQSVVAVVTLVVLKSTFQLGNLLFRVLGTGILPWIVLPLLTLTLVNALWPSTITVGPDGILVATLARRVFHRFADVTGVERSDWGIKLTLKSGRQVEIRTENRANTGTSARREALLARVEQRIEALTARDEGPRATALLARSGRPVEEWLRSLRALAEGEPVGYRGASIPSEELWRIVEDPTSDVTARAGAAVALRKSLDEEGRARLRVAAEASASPRVRVALEAVGGADDTALARALAECSDEPDAPSERGRLVI